MITWVSLIITTPIKHITTFKRNNHSHELTSNWLGSHIKHYLWPERYLTQDLSRLLLYWWQKDVIWDAAQVVGLWKHSGSHIPTCISAIRLNQPAPAPVLALALAKAGTGLWLEPTAHKKHRDHILWKRNTLSPIPLCLPHWVRPGTPLVEIWDWL